MIWEFGRENWEAAAPRPWLLVVRDAVGLVLVAVCAVSVVFLMWAVLP